MTIEQLRREIQKKKKALIKRAKRQGIYENFGQVEVRELRSMIDPAELYGEKGKLIDDFDNWCMDFTL